MKSYIETLECEKAKVSLYLNEKYIVNENVQEEVDGVIVNRIKPVIKDPTEMNSQYKTNDFKLENIIASGTTDLLKESRLTTINMAENENKINELTEKIENYVESKN